MNVEVFKLTAFPNGKNGGNKAGVVLDADHFSDADMQGIAKNVGFSETAFILSSEKAGFRIRYFTPTNEVDLCGHATIAAFNLLRDKKIIKKGEYTLETRVGILNIQVSKTEVFMEQMHPIFFEEVEEFEVLDCFYEERFINKDLPIKIVSTGMREIFVPVKDGATLHKLHPRIKNIEYLSEKYNVIGMHLFALDDKVDAYGRNFAPIVGIEEESATGTSNGALACYLNKFHSPTKTEFVLRQGYSMNMPSEIQARLTKHRTEILKVHVGGSAKILK
jgi:PhzF family phenazine biosynthesis protein